MPNVREYVSYTVAMAQKAELAKNSVASTVNTKENLEYNPSGIFSALCVILQKLQEYDGVLLTQWRERSLLSMRENAFTTSRTAAKGANRARGKHPYIIAQSC
jgi:hypothetical protein